MWWVSLWVLVVILGLVGTVASVNSARFRWRVAQEARALTSAITLTPPALPPEPSALPRPVQRYLTRAAPDRSRMIQQARLRHGGSFRPSLDGSWLPIRGQQYFDVDPPGFVWWGRVRVAPGLWIDARDRSVHGVGNMLVKFESTITLANRSGPELDQGALLRLLGEMVWLPTVFLDTRYVQWSAVDDRRATATLAVNRRTVSATFAFGDDDLPVMFSSDRHRDTGSDTSVLTPFVARVSEFRKVDDVLVPFRVVAAWTLDGRDVEYANFEVQQLQYEWVPVR